MKQKLKSHARRSATLSGVSLGKLTRFTATAALCLAASLAYADGRITGRVTDAATRTGLPGAEVSLSGTNAKAVTATDGSFSLSVPAGTYELTTYYLGYPSQTITTPVNEGATTPTLVSLGNSDTVTLEAFTVEGTREGQARALNQQRTSTNLTSIISSDLSGQFPDKTIADAVKRLPGITVETDTDTGGSEGRYITIRGMNADFNAVSINGMRATVADFGGSSRRVPLDVVSVKSADQIEVTKALRPDQDGDGIGGAVNIVTRSPFDREGLYAFAETAVGYSELLDVYTGDYPYSNPNYEASGGVSTVFGKNKNYGISVAANFRDRAFVKQRVSTGGWGTDGGPTYYPISVIFQDFFDDVSAAGLNSTFEWRPTEDTKVRFDFSHSERDTERGRQRLAYSFNPGGAASNISDDTAGTYTANGRKRYQVRQFFEEQAITNLVGRVETKVGDWKLDYFAGANRGSFDGDPAKDIQATFRTGSTSNTFTNNGYLPGVTTVTNVTTPTNFAFDGVNRGTAFTTDDELSTGLDAKHDASLFGGEGFWKTGFKVRLFDRDYDRRELLYRRTGLTGTWNLGGYTGAALPGGAVIGSSVADYNASSYVDGNYTSPRLFLDPELLRDYSNTLIAAGRLAPSVDNALRSRIFSYEAEENIYATYGQSQFTWGKITALAGARIELTDVNFTGANGSTDAGTGNVDPSTVAAYDLGNDYVNVLPGIHLRYDQNRNLLYRFSVTQSIARPRLSDLNPSVFEDAFGDNDLFLPTVDSGDINLKPTRSTNVDLGVEYYFGAASVLSGGVFYKDMKDNVYRGYDFANINFPGFLVRQSLNAERAWVAGYELAYDHQFTFLPSPFDGFGVFANYTFAESEVDTGLAQFANVNLPLFNQVKHTVNAGLFYNKGVLASRLSLLYRTESLIGVEVDADTLDYDPKLSRYQGPSTTLDFTTSYEFIRDWTVILQLQNVLNEPGQGYDGSESRIDYNEYTDWSASLAIRWNL